MREMISMRNDMLIVFLQTSSNLFDNENLTILDILYSLNIQALMNIVLNAIFANHVERLS